MSGPGSAAVWTSSRWVGERVARCGVPVLVVLVAAVSSLTAQQPGAARRAAVGQLSDSMVQQLVQPRLAADETILPPVFVGAIGPPGRTILAFTDSGYANNYGGFALVDSSGTWLQQRLPMLADNAGQSLDAVLFETTAGDSVPLIVCLGTYVFTRGSHSGEEYNANAVLRWDGHAFVRLPEVERVIERATTAAAVRRILRSRRLPH